MSQRLHQLQRQQALIREHLAWIDAEIAKEEPTSESLTGATRGAPHAFSPTTPDSEPPAPLTLEGPASRPLIKSTPPPLIEVEAALEQYAAAESSKREDARRGCFIIFAIALTLLILGVAAVWWFGYRGPA